jgi:hypothetical protein
LLGFQGVAVMNFRLAVLFCLVLLFQSAASAQQPQNRIDLSADEAAPLPAGSAPVPAISGIAFRSADVVCPEEHGTIEIRSGQMFLVRVSSNNRTRSSKLPGNGVARMLHSKPLDDETYQYEIGNEECRLMLHVRLQTQREGRWQAVLVPYLNRSSVTKEERSAFMRKMFDAAKERRESRKSEPQPPPPQPPRIQLLGDANAVGEAFLFQDTPETGLADCFQAVGTYELGQDGLFVTFLRALPGNLNRLTIERNDVNSYQGRLYFMHGECRFQVTVSGLRKYNSEWVPLTIDRPV